MRNTARAEHEANGTRIARIAACAAHDAAYGDARGIDRSLERPSAAAAEIAAQELSAR
jgi:hypothetical protein